MLRPRASGIQATAGGASVLLNADVDMQTNAYENALRVERGEAPLDDSEKKVPKQDHFLVKHLR